MTLAALLAAAALALEGASAPQAPAPLRLIAHGDTVTLLLPESPPREGGFVVYRGVAGGALVKVTPRPVTAAANGAEAAGVIGSDLDAVERAVQAFGPDDLLRRLRLDPFAAAVLSALYGRVGVALGRIYTDTGLTRGARVVYRVVFTDAAGHETSRSLTGEAQVVDRPPAPPTGLAADVGDHLAKLHWTYPAPGAGAAENVIAFVVYRADGVGVPLRRVTPLPVLRQDSGPLEYVDREVTNGVAYRYEVAALDLAGREGVPSPALAVTPVDRTPPAFPVAVATQVQAGGVMVVWRIAPEPDADGYLVERATELDGPYARLTSDRIPVDRPSWFDSTATGGHRYFYRVIALDRSGNASAPSSIAQAIVNDRTPPIAPESVTAVPREHRLLVRWRRSPSPDVAGYYVYRSAPGRLPSRLNSLPLTDTVFVDSGYGAQGLHPGGRFEIAVTAVDSARNESPKTTARVVVPDDRPPDPPSGLQVTGVGGRYVQIAWSAAQAPDVASYEVSRSAGDSAFALLARVVGQPPFLIRDTAVVHGRRYVYRAVAVDSAGNRSGPAVDSLRFQRPTAPPAPRHLGALATATGIVLTWERVADPELLGYRVYRSPLPTGRFETVGEGVVRGTTITVPPGEPGTYYHVRAVDTSGNESAPSPAARAGTP